MPELKRVTLHPLNPDGSVDLNTNLYPKCFVDGIVDREGNLIDIATQSELDEVESKVDTKQDELVAGENIVIDGNRISAIGSGMDTYTRQEVDAKLDTKQNVLVSGTNIKTINGVPVLGSGDLNIPTGIYVEANPTLSGNEEKLKSIQINDYEGNVHKYNNDLISNVVADAYDKTHTYQEDDFVIYNLTMYRCTGETTGEFDPTKWTQTTVVAMFSSFITGIEEVLTEINSGSGV